jgi:hypothetical protein
MSIELRYPKITGGTVAEQMEQAKSYLHQMVEQLNWALKTIESGSSTSSSTAMASQAKASEEKTDPATNFNSIKALIIKSADIVDAYYEEINRRLSSEYVAQSEYGTFQEQATHDIEENADGIEQMFTNVQQITSKINEVADSVIEVNAHINSGYLYTDDNGVPIYGLEIGQRTEIDGEEVFNKYARFTANRLSFFDQNDLEVAYISDYKLYITNVEITGTFSLGGFLDIVLPGNGVVTRWVGGV